MKGLDPVRIENKLELGVPDVNYVEGWIELKWVRRPPIRGGVLTLDHFTPHQQTWLTRRTHSKGRAFLLLKVSNEWLLFTGLSAAENLGKLTIEELRKVALKTWPKKLDDSELRELLTK